MSEANRNSPSWLTLMALIVPVLSAIFVAFITHQSNRAISELDQQTKLEIQRNQIAADQEKLKAEQDNRKQAFLSEHIPRLLSGDEMQRRASVALLFVFYPNDARDILNNVAPAANEAAQGSLVRASQEAVRVSEQTGAWVIISGGDTTLRAAQDEVARAQRERFDLVAIYKKDNVFRTVIGRFPNRQDAERANVAVRSRIRPDAYVVALSNWCPNPAPQGEGEASYSQCGDR